MLNADPFSHHVLHVEGEMSDWWVEHPASCLVSQYTARQLERFDEPVCEFWDVDPDAFEDRLAALKVVPGLYAIWMDGEEDDGSFHWWLEVDHLPDPPVEPAPFEPTPRRLHYGGSYLRSMGELRVAVLLDLLAVEWKYEPRVFDLDGLGYKPDFVLAPNSGFAPVIEVKSKKAALDLARLLGMPALNGVIGDPSRFDLSHVAVDERKLTDEFRKPFRLAREINRDVWVVGGEPKTHQPYVTFHSDGTASTSRLCPMFADHHVLDEMYRIVRSRRDWHNGREASL